jgi:hypothetical protein
LDCNDPAVYLVNYPAKFNSKYLAGAQFESKSCKVTKTFGNPIEKVLFVFDGQTPVDINSIANTVVSEVRSALGGLATAHTNLKDQMNKFLSTLPHLTSPLGTAYANAPSTSG